MEAISEEVLSLYELISLDPLEIEIDIVALEVETKSDEVLGL